MASKKTAPNKRTRCGAVSRSSTITMNDAFATLRAHLPNVPPDTKLSKIRTLRLATRYIEFLMKSLEESDQERSPHNFDLVFPGEGNSENIVSLIRASGRLIMNIRETLRLPHHLLPLQCLVFFFGQPADSEPKPRKQRTSTRSPQHIWESKLKECKWSCFALFVP